MVTALGVGPSDSWLEPCVGAGVFLRELAAAGIPASRIVAVDLSETPEPADVLAQTWRGVDFIMWSGTVDRRFDKIVANPPYLAISKLEKSLQSPLTGLVAPDGSRLGRNANYWSAFVCASVRLLRPGGSLCFVLPAAWEYANYAAPLRESMPSCFSRFHVHRSRKPLFDGVQDGSVVIIGSGFGERNIEVRHFEYGTGDELIAGLLVARPGNEYDPNATQSPLGQIEPSSVCPLGEVMTIQLGGVTGDASYFLMSEHQRRERGLPLESVRPVVSRAHHLSVAELGRPEWETLKNAGDRVWLFYPPDSLLSHPGVRAYLDLKASEGGCQRDRYKIRNRSPWYRTPLPSADDGFISGMSKHGPWISLRAMPRLTATNTLYVVRFERQISQDMKAAWALSLLTSVARQGFLQCGRAYPDGLLKYEPGDLGSVEVPIPSTGAGARACYLAAVALLLCGEIKQSQAIADDWFRRAKHRLDSGHLDRRSSSPVTGNRAEHSAGALEALHWS